jgi:hypothetical protein
MELIVRFLDKDIKQGLNNVLRILENRVEERSSENETTPPCPPVGGINPAGPSMFMEKTLVELYAPNPSGKVNL